MESERTLVTLLCLTSEAFFGAIFRAPFTCPALSFEDGTLDDASRPQWMDELEIRREHTGWQVPA